MTESNESSLEKNDLSSYPSSQKTSPNENDNIHQFESTAKPSSSTQPDDLKEEYIRLGSRSPLKTILYLSIGPLISQVTNAVYGIVNTIWVSRACGDDGLASISTYNNFDTIRRAFALFLQVAASAKFASLFGQKTIDNQLFSDLLRLALFCGILAPAIFIPLTRPTARWFGATKQIEDEGYEYIFPLLMSTIVPCLYLHLCGCLQAEGRAWTFCIFQVSSMILNMLFFAPFFLLICKTGIAGVSYATICAELIPSIVLFVLYYRGKHFTIKPKLRDLFKKFSSNFLSSVSIGISQLLYQLSLALPGFFIRKYFGLACEGDDEKWGNVMSGFNVSCRYYILMLSVTSALTIGFLPSGSYAFSSERYNRFLKLLFITLLMSVCWSAFTMIFTIGFPRLLTSAFSSSEGVLYWGSLILSRTEYLAFAVPVCVVAGSLLQSMQMGKLATLLNCLTQLIPLPLFSTIMFFTGKKEDVARFIYCYPIYDAFSCVVSIPFYVFPLIPVCRKAKIEKQNENVNDQSHDVKPKLNDNDDEKGIKQPLVDNNEFE